MATNVATVLTMKDLEGSHGGKEVINVANKSLNVPK